jgi:hypothetical protein
VSRKTLEEGRGFSVSFVFQKFLFSYRTFSSNPPFNSHGKLFFPDLFVFLRVFLTRLFDWLGWVCFCALLFTAATFLALTAWRDRGGRGVS